MNKIVLASLATAISLVVFSCDSGSATSGGGISYCKLWGGYCMELATEISLRDCREQDGEIVDAEACGILPSSSSGGNNPPYGQWCVDHDYRDCILVADLPGGAESCDWYWGGVIQSTCPSGYDNASNNGGQSSSSAYTQSSSSGGNNPTGGSYCVDHYIEDCILVSDLVSCGDTCADFGDAVQSSCPYDYIWSRSEWCGY